jgi:hypothetical protein
VNLFLQVLGSGVITTQRKILVLSFFHNITENPQILCDFFVNYDCDLQSPDIFGYTVEKGVILLLLLFFFPFVFLLRRLTS